MKSLGFAVAVALLLTGCDKESAPTGGATPAATPPAATPAQPAAEAATGAPGSAAGAETCDDAALRAKVEGMFEASVEYFQHITPVVTSTEACAVVVEKLSALAPHADAFVAKATGSVAAVKSMGAACQAKAAALGDEMSTKLAERFPDADKLDGQMKALIERCRTHEGFEAAVTQGLRFMKKKAQ